MPGGRLTYQDRQLIAAGLNAGDGYAEIARQLQRPTSTISREIARNGGPRAYDPTQAQQVTGQRARRHRPARLATGADRDGRDRALVSDFEERFSAMMIASGMSRMTARVLVCLMTTDSGNLTAAELIDRLRVSPASISQAVRYLEDLGLVRRERDDRRRRERYFVDDEVWSTALDREVRICTTWSSAAGEGAELLGPETPAGARLRLMSTLFAFVGEQLEAAAELWREQLPTDPRPASDLA
jgi:predicted transcriptional regulator